MGDGEQLLTGIPRIGLRFSPFEVKRAFLDHVPDENGELCSQTNCDVEVPRATKFMKDDDCFSEAETCVSCITNDPFEQNAPNWHQSEKFPSWQHPNPSFDLPWTTMLDADGWHSAQAVYSTSPFFYPDTWASTMLQTAYGSCADPIAIQGERHILGFNTGPRQLDGQRNSEACKVEVLISCNSVVIVDVRAKVGAVKRRIMHTAGIPIFSQQIWLNDTELKNWRTVESHFTSWQRSVTHDERTRVPKQPRFGDVAQSWRPGGT